MEGGPCTIRSEPFSPQNKEINSGGKRAFIVSSLLSATEMDRTIGREAYSYHFVARAFGPLVARLGTIVEVTNPESRVD